MGYFVESVTFLAAFIVWSIQFLETYEILKLISRRRGKKTQMITKPSNFIFNLV